MDIQRGDQVYYRGEVWTVCITRCSLTGDTHVLLERVTERGSHALEIVAPEDVQRVEQVR